MNEKEYAISNQIELNSVQQIYTCVNDSYLYEWFLSEWMIATCVNDWLHIRMIVWELYCMYTSEC